MFIIMLHFQHYKRKGVTMAYRNVALSPEAHKALKFESVVTGKPMGKLLNDIIKERFE